MKMSNPDAIQAEGFGYLADDSAGTKGPVALTTSIFDLPLSIAALFQKFSKFCLLRQSEEQLDVRSDAVIVRLAAVGRESSAISQELGKTQANHALKESPAASNATDFGGDAKAAALQYLTHQSLILNYLSRTAATSS
jgi:hypothetical protein